MVFGDDGVGGDDGKLRFAAAGAAGDGDEPTGSVEEVGE